MAAAALEKGGAPQQPEEEAKLKSSEPLTSEEDRLQQERSCAQQLEAELSRLRGQLEVSTAAFHGSRKQLAAESAALQQQRVQHAEELATEQAAGAAAEAAAAAAVAAQQDQLAISTQSQAEHAA